MFLESFHRLLKVMYFEHKRNRRIGFLLSVLLKIARDKVFEQLTKLEKGKYTHRVAEINKGHKSALNMYSSEVPVTQKDEQCWTVPSQRDTSVHYSIQLINNDCKCKQRCTSCHACVHMYTCTCMDATLHATICKHVHLVRLTTTSDTSTINTTADTSTMNTTTDTSTKNTTTYIPETNMGHSIDYFTNVFGNSKSTNCTISTVRLQVQQQIDKLDTLLKNCEHPDTLLACKKHLTSAITMLKVIGHTSSKPAVLSRKRNYPPNKNIEQQPRFFSTKKRKLLLLFLLHFSA